MGVYIVHVLVFYHSFCIIVFDKYSESTNVHVSKQFPGINDEDWRIYKHIFVVRYERFLGWRGRWLQDGLHSSKTMTYNVLSKSVEPLYTNITVDLLYHKNKEINVAEDTTKESLWW